MATIRTRIGPADQGRPMSLEEFRDADADEGYRYELSRGVVEVTQVPNDPHRQILDNLRDAVSLYRHFHPGLILCLGGGAEFQLEIQATKSERHPDLGIVFSGTLRDERGRRQPSWVAEIVSPGLEARRWDYQAKQQDYLLFGLREYWIVDPQQDQVTVLARAETQEGPVWLERIFRGDETIESRLLPDFQATVAQLWINAELDEEQPL
jgi:Uma2 family endonuclease